jgi:formylglycine-generating enzyme required for sulfatase activity
MISCATARIGAQGKDQQGQELWGIETRTVTLTVFEEVLGEGVPLELVGIPSGTFTMGSPPGEEGRDMYAAAMDDDMRKAFAVEGVDVEAQRRISVPAFLMGRHPITQAQWRVVAGWPRQERELDPEPSHFLGDQRPVEQVSWHDAVEFCHRLSLRTGRPYALPSEAQWEYACRAGGTKTFHFGATLSPELANYDASFAYGTGPKGEYRQQTSDVGSFPANAWGLHDMHGNVVEWCLDRWHPSLAKGPTDGSAWLEPGVEVPKEYRDWRLLRGGSWLDYPVLCRSAFRYSSRPGSLPGIRSDDVGFRVCALPPGSGS